jgi:hypothetical protein
MFPVETKEGLPIFHAIAKCLHSDNEFKIYKKFVPIHLYVFL